MPGRLFSNNRILGVELAGYRCQNRSEKPVKKRKPVPVPNAGHEPYVGRSTTLGTAQFTNMFVVASNHSHLSDGALLTTVRCDVLEPNVVSTRL